MYYKTENPHGGDIYGGDILLDFSANTNPFGTPEGVLEAVKASLAGVSAYPDPFCRALVQAIAQSEGVPADYILCGNGASELIDAYCRALKPKKGAELAPAFSEYSKNLELEGCTPVRCILTKEQDFLPGEGLLDFIEETKPQVLFLCSPANPTGQVIPRSLLEKALALCKELGTSVFLDECFFDLTLGEQSAKDLLSEYPNLLILKAFTKSYGMAGLRLGYCLCADEKLLSRMAACCQPWNVSTPAQAAGIAALKETEFLKRTQNLVAKERQVLSEGLKRLGLYVCPSKANYLLFQGPEGLDKALQKEQIAIRSCRNYPGLGEGWYRIAVKLPNQNDVLLSALERALGKE